MAAPRHHTPRSNRDTRGGQVGALARAKGQPLMPWQQDAADVALEIDPATGLYWYGIVLVTVPRQSGKTKLEGDVADHRCLTLSRARVWLTMQTGKDAAAWMRDEHFDSAERLTPSSRPGRPGRWRRDKRAGAEGVAWAHGSTFRVFPPTRDGLHSKQGDLVFADEAWAHDREAGAALRQAIRPTMVTRRGSQLWVVSTKGDDKSAYLNDYVDLGEASLDDPHTRVCIIDYGIGEDDDPDDLDVIAAAHPAYGHTIDMPALRGAYDDFMADPEQGLDGWKRGYGNRPTRTRTAAIPGNVWTPLGTDSLADVPERVGLALDVDEGPDGPVAAIGAGWRVDDLAHVRVLHSGPPARDLPALAAALCNARQSPLGYDPTAPGILDVTDAIARNHPEVTLEPQSSGQYAGACVNLARAAMGRTLRHGAQPDLDEAVKIAVKRNMVDGGFGWHRRGSAGPIAALIAPTIALRVFDTMPAPLTKPVLHFAHPARA